MNADSWTAGATVALVIVGITQAALFVWQLTLLRRSVRDSAAAARAATEAADAARAANRISREAISNDQRPWVTLKTILNPIAVPLSYGLRDGWRIELRYALTNIGKTPARRVGFMTEVIPSMMGHQEPGGPVRDQTHIANELHDFARRMLNAKAGGGGFNLLLFPGDTREASFVINRSDAPFAGALESPHYSGQLIVLTCAIYQSTLDGSWHETAEAYSLAVQGQRIALTNGAFDVTDRILSFVSHPMADPYAS
jgi:hypothetical protein